jgi:hypothetical protein
LYVLSSFISFLFNVAKAAFIYTYIGRTYVHTYILAYMHDIFMCPP